MWPYTRINLPRDILANRSIILHEFKKHQQYNILPKASQDDILSKTIDIILSSSCKTVIIAGGGIKNYTR